MATPRDLRRLALLALYQIEAAAGRDTEAPQSLLAEIREQLESVESLEAEGLSFIDAGPDRPFRPVDLDRALAMAAGAWAMRARADALVGSFAPEWPAHRQAAIDRCILRLAIYEMFREESPAPPKAVINEAVELARLFSTERSPGFVNALLDRAMRTIPGADGSSTGAADIPLDADVPVGRPADDAPEDAPLA